MNETAVTRIDTHMRELVPGDCEKDKIAWLQGSCLDPFAFAVLFSSGAWNFHTCLAIAVVHQATAVETPGVRTTITIGHANHVMCNGKSAVG